MSTTVSTWQAFREKWAGPLNFMLGGECVPFGFDFPPVEVVIDILRADADVRVSPGTRGDRLLKDDIAPAFRAMPLEQAVDSSFGIAHYSLSRFDKPGGFLHGFERRVLDPWREALKANGFTFDRCYPIIFISGRGCATNYHMDFSHVLAWQIHGRKRFCGLRDPAAWTTRESRVNYNPTQLVRPEKLTDADALCHDMPPGSALWNVLLTPHWVEASESVAMSVNLSHGGLKLEGRLSPFEDELEDHRRLLGLGPAVKASY